MTHSAGAGNERDLNVTAQRVFFFFCLVLFAFCFSLDSRYRSQFRHFSRNGGCIQYYMSDIILTMACTLFADTQQPTPSCRRQLFGQRIDVDFIFMTNVYCLDATQKFIYSQMKKNIFRFGRKQRGKLTNANCISKRG